MQKQEGGQSTVEMLILMVMFALFTFGSLHVGIVIVVRHSANYAAFAAARQEMVHGDDHGGEAQAAAGDVLFPFTNANFATVQPAIRQGRRGVIVPFPFSLGTLTSTGRESVLVEGFAPAVIQPAIPETGDNAR
jgi:TadE-like protein